MEKARVLGCLEEVNPKTSQATNYIGACLVLESYQDTSFFSKDETHLLMDPYIGLH